MRVAAITAEYNPFHNGHAWQIRFLKEQAGFDFVLAVMSPDFVQRGEPAVTDMYARARAALAGGVDAVFALPVCLATGSAAFFAAGAVGIIDALGIADVLSFGCEEPDPDALQALAALFNEEPPAYREALRRALAAGVSYPAAREQAAAAQLASQSDAPISKEQLHRLVSSPNSILAIEYLRAIQRLESPLTALPLQRQGSASAYHSAALPGDSPYASASAIRAALKEADDGRLLAPYIPARPLQILLDSLARGRRPVEEKYDLLLCYALHSAFGEAGASPPDLPDMDLQLSNRITAHLSAFKSAADFTDLLHTKNLTRSRVSRALLHLVLGIPQSQPRSLLTKSPGEGAGLYAQLLGFRREAAPLLSQLQRRSRIPVITKPAAAKTRLSKAALSAFETDMHAQAVYNMLCVSSDCRIAYQRSPILWEDR